MRRVVFHIDRLVLKGFTPTEGDAIGEGVREELRRLFSDPSGSAGLHTVSSMPTVRAGMIRLDSTPRASGAAMAEATMKGLLR